ncbi:hypothetical protein Tco_0752967 [Tanacetum coccineum]|uniref:Uncharacterized protein n=1 Tax=Tanacetum coccineum TaxID=301880 RepID=A0ABQ4ZN56_9ASTR
MNQVTHTEVSSPFEDLSDIGSPRADDHEFLELPYMPEDPYLEAALQAPPSPDYVPGPEEPEQAPLSPDYVPGPEHADDEIQSEEDDDEDPEEDPIDYPTDGGDDGNDEMDIDEDDDMDIDADEEMQDDECHREDRPEVNLPPQKRLGIALGPSYEVGESSTAVAARPAGDSWDEIVKTLQGAPVSTDTELGAHVRDFESMVRSMDASDLARAEVMSLRTTVHAQMSEIIELQSADRNRRRAILDLLETDCGRREEMRELRSFLIGQVTALQGQVMALQGQVTALQGQQGPTGGPAQPELPGEAGSST